MNISSFIVSIVLILCCNNLFAQGTDNFDDKFLSAFNNIDFANTKSLTSGIYLISVSDKEFSCVEYANISDTVELERNFLFFKMKSIANYITTKSTIYYGGRFLRRYMHNSIYLVCPKPIALKKNIIRIYDCIDKNPNNSSGSINGLMFKIINYDDSLFKKKKKINKEFSCLGLVINNELVAINHDDYFELKENDTKICYLTFYFYENSDCVIEDTKHELFQQTLIKK